MAAVTLPCRAARLLLTVLLPVVLLTLSLDLTLRSDWPSPLLFASLGIEQRVPDARQQHQRVLDFYLHGRSLAGSAFTTRERQHLQDVEGLLQLGRWVGVGGLLLGLGLFWGCARPWRTLVKGSLLLLGLLSGVGLLATRWVLLFRGLHPLLFPGGGWDFDPAVHLLPRLYTQDYLALYGGAVLGTAVLGAGLLYALGRWRGPRADALRWGWGRAEWGLLAAGVVLSGPAWWAGRHMYLPGDAAWDTFYGLAALLLAATVALWLGAHKALGATLLLAALLPYQSFACGVRHAALQARDYVADTGARVVAALERYRDERGRAPPSLGDLVPRYLAALPPTPAGEPWWYLHSPNFRYYGVGFAGPLAYRHMYASPSGQWELLPLP
jgi:hypothetical protein